MQAARGVDGVQVSVWVDAVRITPVPGTTWMRVRFQRDGKGTDCEGEPGCERGEAPEDLNVGGYYGDFAFLMLIVASKIIQIWWPGRSLVGGSWVGTWELSLGCYHVVVIQFHVMCKLI